MSVLKAMDTVLSRIAGQMGSRSLIARAVTVAHAGSPWRGSERITPEGVMEHLEKRLSAISSEERIAGEVAVVSSLLGLLHTFIGEQLTLQLIQDAWPHLDPEQLVVRKGPHHEQKNNGPYQ